MRIFFANIKKIILQLKCCPDTQLLKLILMKGAKESGIEKTVANTVAKLRVGNDLWGIQLAEIDAFLVGEVRYEINVFQNQKRGFKHDVPLDVGVGGIVQIPTQQVEISPEAVVPVLQKIAFGKIDEVGKIFSLLVDEAAGAHMVLKGMTQPERDMLADVEFNPVILCGASQNIEKTA